jgi:predicted translin family RNA/ssDNA-binding protein
VAHETEDRQKLDEAQALLAKTREDVRRAQTLHELDAKLQQLETLLRAMQI